MDKPTVGESLDMIYDEYPGLMESLADDVARSDWAKVGMKALGQKFKDDENENTSPDPPILGYRLH